MNTLNDDFSFSVEPDAPSLGSIGSKQVCDLAFRTFRRI
jgi:hypothetical protein